MARHICLEMAPKRTTKLHFYGYSKNLVAALVIRKSSCPPHFPGAQEDIKEQYDTDPRLLFEVKFLEGLILTELVDLHVF